MIYVISGLVSFPFVAFVLFGVVKLLGCQDPIGDMCEGNPIGFGMVAFVAILLMLGTLVAWPIAARLFTVSKLRNSSTMGKVLWIFGVLFIFYCLYVLGVWGVTQIGNNKNVEARAWNSEAKHNAYQLFQDGCSEFADARKSQLPELLQTIDSRMNLINIKYVETVDIRNGYISYYFREPNNSVQSQLIRDLRVFLSGEQGGLFYRKMLRMYSIYYSNWSATPGSRRSISSESGEASYPGIEIFTTEDGLVRYDVVIRDSKVMKEFFNTPQIQKPPKYITDIFGEYGYEFVRSEIRDRIPYIWSYDVRGLVDIFFGLSHYWSITFSVVSKRDEGGAYSLAYLEHVRCRYPDHYSHDGQPSSWGGITPPEIGECIVGQSGDLCDGKNYSTRRSSCNSIEGSDSMCPGEWETEQKLLEDINL